MNNDGLLSVLSNDEDCPAYVRDANFLNQRDGMDSRTEMLINCQGIHLSRVHLRRRLFFKRHQRLITIIHNVNKLLGHTQIDRKSGTKSLCNVSLRVLLSCSCQNDSLAFRTQARTTQHQVAASNVRQLNSLSCCFLKELSTAACTPQYVHPCQLSNERRHPVIPQSCRVSEESIGTIHDTKFVDVQALESQLSGSIQ